MEEHSPVTLLHLRKFRWTGPLDEWDVFLYTYIRLPNVTDLIFEISTSTNPSTDPDLRKSFLRQIKKLTTLEGNYFRSTQECLDLFDIFSATVHTLQLTFLKEEPDTLRLLNSLQITDGDIASRNYFPNLKSFGATLNFSPNIVKHMFDILYSRRIHSTCSVPITPNFGNSFFTMLPLHFASKWSSLSRSLTALSASASLPRRLLRARHASDYPVKDVVNDDHWAVHTRLEDATIQFRGSNFRVGRGERELARLLERSGLNLKIIARERRGVSIVSRAFLFLRKQWGDLLN